MYYRRHNCERQEDMMEMENIPKPLAYVPPRAPPSSRWPYPSSCQRTPAPCPCPSDPALSMMMAQERTAFSARQDAPYQSRSGGVECKPGGDHPLRCAPWTSQGARARRGGRRGTDRPRRDGPISRVEDLRSCRPARDDQRLGNNDQRGGAYPEGMLRPLVPLADPSIRELLIRGHLLWLAFTGWLRRRRRGCHVYSRSR